MTERIVKKYHGIELVAAFYQGAYQGKAWGKKAGQALAHVTGSSINDVLERLRQAVNSPELQAEFKRALIEKHGEFLRLKGIDPGSIPAHGLARIYDQAHRTIGCYACKSGLDNEIDLECPRCSWIICTSCGACGCGHPQFGPKINRRAAKVQSSSSVPQPQDRAFPDFASASEHARQCAGSTLRPHPTGDGYLVTYKVAGGNDT